MLREVGIAVFIGYEKYSRKWFARKKVQCYITLGLLQSVVKIRFKFLATSRKKNHMAHLHSCSDWLRTPLNVSVNSFVFAIRALPYSLPLLWRVVEFLFFLFLNNKIVVRIVVEASRVSVEWSSGQEIFRYYLTTRVVISL